MSPIANMLIQIKNAQAAGHERVTVPFSQVKFNIASLLETNGFITSAEQKNKKIKRVEIPCIDIALKYNDQGGAIHDVRLISKPSRRVYAGKNQIQPIRNGRGIAIVSTSRGLMTGDEARKAGLGGEVICEVW